MLVPNSVVPMGKTQKNRHQIGRPVRDSNCHPNQERQGARESRKIRLDGARRICAALLRRAGQMRALDHPGPSRKSGQPVNGRDQVRQYALENGYQLSTPYGLDTFTRPDGRKVEVDYARGGVRIQGIWVNNQLARGSTRSDALAALRGDDEPTAADLQ